MTEPDPSRASASVRAIMGGVSWDQPTAQTELLKRSGLRLRSRLMLAMILAALVPMSLASIGVGVVVSNLDPGSPATRLVIRSLIVGGVAALGIALVLALVWSRRMGTPIAKLHRGAIAVSHGDLDHHIAMTGADELTDLAAAFNQMTHALKDNRARLAQRMREIVALHDAGRAVSSVIDLDQVSCRIVDAVASVLDVQLAGLWLFDADPSPPASDRARLSAVTTALATPESLVAAEALRPLAEHAFSDREAMQLVRAGDDPRYGEAARRAGVTGPLVALPLDRNNRMIGVLAIARAESGSAFTEADLSLLKTFADQAAAALENAQLYREVRGASAELDKKVKLRTEELTAINSELGRALADLRETQAQLVLSERMAGLGLLVAGVAHEINSPTAAIRGSCERIGPAIARVGYHGALLAAESDVRRYVEQTASRLAERPLVTGLRVLQTARELEAVFHGVERASDFASDLANLGFTMADGQALVAALGGRVRDLAPRVVAALTDYVYLHRTESTVRHAVAQIERIVGALKSYSHLDQQATRIEADLHDGLETTLTLLHYSLRDIVVERRYSPLPKVHIFVDELNQVWTNLISNAQYALAGKGQIAIETAVEGNTAIVRIIDDGPGVPAAVLPRIFEAFFTTKPKGEGSGLGLGIARQIVAKHGGDLRCESRPGRTCFEVRLPVQVAT